MAVSRAVRRFITAAVAVGAALLPSALPATAHPLSNATGALFGAAPAPSHGETRPQATTDLEALIGRKLGVLRVYDDWNSTFPSAENLWARDSGHTLSLSVRSKKADGTPLLWKDIAAAVPGTALYDDIVRWGNSFKSFGAPIYFTFMHEPEEASNDVSGSSAEYIAAWRKIVDTFRSLGVTNLTYVNVTTAYSYTLPTTDRRYAPTWYPGDDYVDFVGVDGYNWSTCRCGINTPWKTFSSLFTPPLNFATSRNKDLYIAEWGSVEDPNLPGRKAEWINDAHALLKTAAWSRVRVVLYWNNTDQKAKACVWRVDSSASSLDAFTSMANDPFFTPTYRTAPEKPAPPTAAAGNGQATVTWAAPPSDGGSPIIGYRITTSPGGQTTDVSASTSSTTITGLTNGTTYTFTVTASNAIGPSAPSDPSNPVTPQVPAAVPGKPAAPTASAGNGQATVTWSPPSDGGSPITGYRITRLPGGQTTDVDAGATSTTITGLTNGTSYTFTVTASNAVGAGPASDPSNAVTPQAPADTPAKPVAPTAVAGDAQATVSWSAPSDGGSPITSYRITTLPGGATTTVAASTTSTTITGLTNGASYTFTVTAVNGVGAGPASDPSNAVTPKAPTTVPGKPAAPTATAGDGAATVTWSAPSDGGSPITSYRVTASPGGQTTDVGAGTTSTTITGLSNGTTYSFTVTASNGVGAGPASDASNAVTPVPTGATVPGKPAPPIGDPGNQQVTLTWSPPAADGGTPVTAYRITTFPGAATRFVTGTTTTITGLTNGSTYTFTVAAFNAVGIGPDSDPSDPQTPRFITFPLQQQAEPADGGVTAPSTPSPAAYVTDASLREGNSGQALMVFTIWRNGSLTCDASVAYTTVDGTAKSARGDYVPTSGTATFAPGSSTTTVSVPVNGDLEREPNENFTLNLSAPYQVVLGDASANATILDDEGPNGITVDNAAVVEGNTGTTTLNFTVSLMGAPPSGKTVTVNYATSDGTATVANKDYAAKSGTLTFAAGQTTATIPVTVNGDTVAEANEIVNLKLTAPANAYLADAAATGTIVTDDGKAPAFPSPWISANDIVVNEGDSGQTNALFTVRLNKAPASGTVTVKYAVADGTTNPASAAAGDYVAPPAGTLTFGAGQTTQTVAVPVNGDTYKEANETFVLNLSSPTGGTLADAQAQATILDEEGPNWITMADVTVMEGSPEAPSQAALAVRLAAPPAAGQAITVAWTTATGAAASAGPDFTASSGTVTFTAGQNVAYIVVPITGDHVAEASETFLIKLSAPIGATLADAAATVTVVDDD